MESGPPSPPKKRERKSFIEIETKEKRARPNEKWNKNRCNINFLCHHQTIFCFLFSALPFFFFNFFLGRGVWSASLMISHLLSQTHRWSAHPLANNYLSNKEEKKKNPYLKFHILFVIFYYYYYFGCFNSNSTRFFCFLFGFLFLMRRGHVSREIKGTNFFVAPIENVCVRWSSKDHTHNF